MKRDKCSGFTIIEATISMAILLVIIMTSLSVIAPIIKLKTSVDQSVGLSQITMQFRDCIYDDREWVSTVADPANASLGCASDGIGCDNGQTSYISLKTGSEPCVAGYDTNPGLSKKGFMRDGSLCDGFSDTGNDNCPFRFNVYWVAQCSKNETKCKSPRQMVYGQMVYKPSQNNRPVNLSRYSVSAIKGTPDQNRHFNLVEAQRPGVPGGSCVGTGKLRALNLVQDPGGYVKNIAADHTITLSPGLYDCHISVPGFAVGNFKANLMDVDNGRILLSGTSEFSPNISGLVQSRSEIVGTFSLATETRVAVLQICASIPTDANMQLQTMGVPMGVGPEIYTVMNCSALAGKGR